MRSILLFGIMFVLGLSTASGQDQKAREKILEKYEKGRIYAGIRLADKMLSGKHTDPSFRILRAEGLNKIGEYDRAARDARAAMAQVSGEQAKEAALQLGIAAMQTGRNDSARYWLESAVGASDEGEALIRLGRLEMLDGDHAAAMDRFNTVLREQPQNVRALLERGAAFASMGDTAAARADLDKAVELAPRDPVALNSRGFHVHAARDRHEKAIEDYDQAIKYDPNYSFAFNNRGWSYYKLGDVKKARKNIRTAAKKRSGNPFIYRNLGVIELETGDTTRACRYFQQALDLKFEEAHGMEVTDLVRAHCGGSTAPVEKPFEVPPSNAPADKPVRSNAPRSNAP